MERIPVRPQHITISGACIRLVKSAAEFPRCGPTSAGSSLAESVGRRILLQVCYKSGMGMPIFPTVRVARVNGLCHDEPLYPGVSKQNGAAASSCGTVMDRR
jgi:hypothetical protein